MRKFPLEGLRVFEFGSNVAGPYIGWILAELGADVTKIERPEGDDARTWGPPFWNGSSTMFHAINRNKKSLCVDLTDPDNAEALRARIVEEADVVVQNLRPGVAAKLGFSAESLRKEIPGLIYCNLNAYGAAGPLRNEPGYDSLMQAFGGIMSVTGVEGSPPVRAGVSIIDKGTAMWCVIGVLAALYERKSTGIGCVVDGSLLETTLGWMAFHFAGFQATGEAPERLGTSARGVVPYQGYECSDGYLIVAASNDRLFVKLCGALDRPEWIDDDRFVTNPRRVENKTVLNKMLEELLKTRTREEWQEILNAAGVPTSPIQTVEEALHHEQTTALGMAQETGDDSMKLFGLPVSFDGERPPLRNLAPPLGDAGQVNSPNGAADAD